MMLEKEAEVVPQVYNATARGPLPVRNELHKGLALLARLSPLFAIR